MRANPLRISVQVAAALGILSIGLAGEVTPAWLAASGMAWIFSLMGDRFSGFQTGLRRLETAAVVGMIATLFLDFFIFHNSVFIAITHFLLLFQIVKLLGEKTRKDCLQIFVFAFFQILAACTLSVDAWHAVILFILIPTATAALFWNQIELEHGAGPRAAEVQRNYRRMATLICAAALPLNLVLTLIVFVLFPRLTLNAALPGFIGHRTGYTNQVNLAQKGALSQDATVVLWLNFPKAEERGLWTGYLRGEVLSQFNGHEWSVSRSARSRMLAPDSNGIFFVRPQTSPPPLIHQTITLADTSANTLFAIGRPLRILAPLPALQENEGGSLHWSSSWRRPVRYEVTSESYADTEIRSIHLEQPPVPLERIRRLAQKIAGSGPPLQQARNIEKFLLKNYRYSTNFGDRITENPVDTFLFKRREGSCGHFASAMALMLRLQNIPSRLVAGYYKGEWNEPAQSVVIRERDAHAWVEAYIPEKGWVSFDPTPNPVAGPVARQNLALRLAQYWDYFGLQWNQFVIQYDLYSQIKAFENLKGTSGRWGAQLSGWWSSVQFRFHRSRRSLHHALVAENRFTLHFHIKEMSLFFSLTLISLLLLIRKHQSGADSTIRFYNRFLERMARDGEPKDVGETGWEFAARLARSHHHDADLARQVTERYYHLRFSPKGSL